MFSKSKSLLRASSLVMLGALAIGCGDDDDDVAGGGGNPDGSVIGGGGNGDGGTPSTGVNPLATVPYTGTLVTILGTTPADKIGVSHELEVLNNDTGAPFSPAIKTTSAAGTGAISFKSIEGKSALHVVGVGAAGVADSTYDTFIVNIDSKTPDSLIRISSAGTLALAEQTGGFVGKADRAALGATIYWSPGGKRMGTVGCAKVYLDGQTTPDLTQDQRYNGTRGLPLTLEQQAQTTRGGRFYIANMTKGKHKVKVTLDDGASFLGSEIEFLVPATRADAKSPTKSVIVQLGVDIDLPANPTKDTCVDPT